MPSPACTINALTPPQDVAASSTVTLALANASGVVFWGLTCIGTDETTTAAAVNATLAVNSSAKTATFTAGGLGTATIWQSTVGVGSKSQQGAGCDANNAVQPSYTTTFKVNVKAANGNRVLVVNEVNEQDSTFGWINEVNAALRGEQTSTITLLGDVTGNTSASVVSGISGVSPIAITPASLSWAIGTASPSGAIRLVSNRSFAKLAVRVESTGVADRVFENVRPGEAIEWSAFLSTDPTPYMVKAIEEFANDRLPTVSRSIRRTRRPSGGERSALLLITKRPFKIYL